MNRSRRQRVPHQSEGRLFTNYRRGLKELQFNVAARRENERVPVPALLFLVGTPLREIFNMGVGAK
jgi:hypothetical protein